MLHSLSVIVILTVCIAFGYCGGRDHGFHDFLKYFGLDD